MYKRKRSTINTSNDNQLLLRTLLRTNVLNWRRGDKNTRSFSYEVCCESKFLSALIKNIFLHYFLYSSCACARKSVTSVEKYILKTAENRTLLVDNKCQILSKANWRLGGKLGDRRRFFHSRNRRHEFNSNSHINYMI